MSSAHSRFFAAGRLVTLALVAVCLATPASAQFGGLKKKLKADAAAKAAEKAGGEAGAEAPAGPAAATSPAAAPASASAGSDGSIIVLTPDVVDRLMTGLKAGKTERQTAVKEDTPYGRYLRADAASKAAKSKCEAAQQGWVARMSADEKLANRSQALLEKMTNAAGKQDTAMMRVYQDSTLAMIDPSCIVRETERPSDLYDMQRAIDNRAEQATLKSGNFTATEYGQVSDRVIAILSDAPPPGGASAAEKAAVTAKGPELKTLLGLRDAQDGRMRKSAPTPAPAPAAIADTAPPPAMPAAASAATDCMARNAQKHEAEIQALGERGQAANKAGNTAAMMAIADTINRITMAGCTGRQ
ncbi:MAG: hypothetical protein ACJ8DC_17980 [Gemmatimonadales bacterium]